MKKPHVWINIDVGRFERLGYNEQIFDTGAELVYLPYDLGGQIGLEEHEFDFISEVSIAGETRETYLAPIFLYIFVDGKERRIATPANWEINEEDQEPMPLIIPPFPFLELGYRACITPHSNKAGEGLITIQKRR